MDGLFGDGLVDVLCGGDSLEEDLRWGPRLGASVDLVKFVDGVTNCGVTLFKIIEPGMCEHRFCSQTKTIGDRNCTACFSLANIFNQSTNKSFGAKLQSEVMGGFTQVRIGNLINQSATSCAISIPPLLEDCSEQKTFKDVARRRLR